MTRRRVAITTALLLAVVAFLRLWRAEEKRAWHEVHSFAYQLQNVDLDEVAASPFDLMVCDPTAEGSDATRWTPEQIARIRRKPGGARRYVLAYLSIGEAEEYRAYWQPGFRPGSPVWLLEPNPQWPDNHTVAFWDTDWQALMLRATERIVEAGFDGVYLDIVDAYERFPNRPQAAEEMSLFVVRIARHARARGGADFGVFAQNGDGLLDHQDYLQALTGLGREDTYFGYPSESHASPAEWTRSIESRLDRALKAGKLILNISYTQVPSQKAQAHARATERGYLEYVTRRELDRLEEQNGDPPEGVAASPGGSREERSPRR